MSADEHVHPHDHPHPRAPATDGEDWPAHYEIMTKALRELLIEKGLITADALRTTIEALQSPGPHWGARIVARAWADPAFKARLLADGKAACAELGLTVGEAQLVVVENTPAIHNLVCCTLCSCYPRSILGQPPAWYVSRSYRARAVREPRAVMAELGLDVPAHKQVRVHDSNADMRYLVLPERPAGSEGLGEEALAALVTRDSMIGAGLARAP